MEEGLLQSPRSRKKSRHTLWFLAAFYSLALIDGVRQAYSYKQSLLDLMIPVAFAYTLALWALADARLRDHPVPLTSRSWFVLLPTLLVPAYLVWSRGWRGVGWLALNTVGWSLLSAFAIGAGAMALSGL